MKITNNFKKYTIGAAVIALSVLPTVGQNASASTLGSLAKLGSFDSGSGIGGAEISAFDPATARIFSTNKADKRIDIVDISNPRKPKKVGEIKLASLGVTSVQSVAVNEGIVAIATIVGAKTDPGRIFFADVQGKLLKQTTKKGVVVGAKPASIHFSPDGQFVVTANEGEPSSYCKTGGKLTESTDPNGSISIIDMSKARLSAVTLDFTAFKERDRALTYAGARIFGPGASVAQDLEPKYVAITEDSRYAYVTLQENNGVAVVDLASQSILAINGLGFKDYSVVGSGLDVSDKDGIKIANRPAYGMYQPDNIAALTTGGSTFLFTANTGAAREYACLMGGTSTTALESENVRFGTNANSAVDATLKSDAQMGRLLVTPFSPASVSGAPIISTTTVSTAYTFGSRSISVWAASNIEGVFPMKQVWDSGQFLEAYTSAAHPATFNADWDTTNAVNNKMDSQSPSNGPNPKGLALGQAYGRYWLVVGLERDGGLMLFDVTAPTSPVFNSYINNLPTVYASSTGQVSPEGLLFIGPKDSPNGKPLVISSYGLSGTVGIYSLVGPS